MERESKVSPWISVNLVPIGIVLYGMKTKQFSYHPQ